MQSHNIDNNNINTTSTTTTTNNNNNRRSSSGVGCYGGGHPCIILCPGQGSNGGCGGRDCHGEKNAKYSALLNTHVFFPLAMETLGPINVTGQNFLRDLGRKLTTSTGDKRETCFLLQRLSITIQRFN